jgi:AAA domain/UvrD-like helicase C-terminal domain
MTSRSCSNALAGVLGRVELTGTVRRVSTGSIGRLVAIVRVEIVESEARMTARMLPYRHLSVRVPWHDTGWEGSVCSDPLANAACLRLGRIAEGRDDLRELNLAGRSWEDIPEDDLPPCTAERAGFMSPRTRHVTKRHPYASWNEVYSKFQPTSYQVPAYSADCVPFRWMLRESAAEIADEYQLPYEPGLEEAVDSEASLNNPRWVQHAKNQQLLLGTFFSAVAPERSLFFVYAKESPLSGDPRRILIGAGRALNVGQTIPYVQNGDGFGSVLWERVIRHSIRPSMEDGFLLPYHELLRMSAEEDVDPEEHAVFVPEEFSIQFSYASEHVSHDAALSLLLALDRAVEKFAPLVAGAWAPVRKWLSDRVGEVWQARGPCPGLGSALSAFGIHEGVLLAFAAQSRVADNEDPWALVDNWLRDPTLEPEASERVSSTLSRTWAAIPDSRRALLRLLSRFDLTVEQATRLYQETERQKAGIHVSDAELLANPYLIYERERLALDPVAVGVVDRGVFPDDRIRHAHPLPEPSRVDDPVDPRRVRAQVIDVLEQAAVEGDSVRPQERVVQDIRDRPLQPGCPVSLDVMAVCAESLPPEVATVAMANGDPAYQLARLVQARQMIARQVNRRRTGARLSVRADWREVIDCHLPKMPADDGGDEELARQEKAAALEILATSRISVLIGAAGTGKTTLLRALSALPEVRGGGLRLLAPTGKARVRMQEAIGREAGATAQTLAQLLVQIDRYDPDTGRYHRSEHSRAGGARTVIVDESSMLTEEALDALLDGIEGFDRLILVGDPRQLPPIGTGRPFVDIVQHLRKQCGTLGFPRVGPSYAELTVPRRQVGGNDRADLLLAEWFAGDVPSPGADEVLQRLGSGEAFDTISLRRWATSAELHDLLRAELTRVVPQESAVDDFGFQESYGGKRVGDYIYFNIGAAEKAEAWQVLSPVRASGGGVTELNRLLQRSYRGRVLDLAHNKNRYARKIPQPAGPQEIVYGDKVINIRNKSRKQYYPERPDVLEYVANGEIGVVTGPFRAKGKHTPLNRLEVEFSTQLGTAYKFWRNELGGDDNSSILELAYAVTIHKSQGSEFGLTFVVLPNPCRLLSRELLYTALTRQRDHVVVLTQGELADLTKYSNVAYSETAARLTNLFDAPTPVEVDGRFLEAGLIHKTRKGVAVRSKSEVIIADLLFSKQIEFQYERPLTTQDGSWRLPDFTIEDDTTGRTIYWEHLGMLHLPSYRRKWEAKLAWYRAHGVLPEEEGGGPNGTLVTTEDGEDGSISSADIEALVDRVLG